MNRDERMTAVMAAFSGSETGSSPPSSETPDSPTSATAEGAGLQPQGSTDVKAPQAGTPASEDVSATPSESAAQETPKGGDSPESPASAGGEAKRPGEQKADEMIPRYRLNDVAKSRDAARARVKELEAENARLRAQATQPVQPQRQQPQSSPQTQSTERRSWADDLLGGDEPTGQGQAQPPEGQYRDPRFDQLQQEFQSMRRERAMQALNAEIQEAQSAYPDVPREVFVEAVRRDANVALSDVAEGYVRWVQGLVSKHAPAAPAAQPPAAPPSSVVRPPAAPPPPVRQPDGAGPPTFRTRADRVNHVASVLEQANRR